MSEPTLDQLEALIVDAERRTARADFELRRQQERITQLEAHLASYDARRARIRLVLGALAGFVVGLALAVVAWVGYSPQKPLPNPAWKYVPHDGP